MTICYIGEASARSGLSLDTIRYYDSLGLTRNSARDGSGRRQFDDEAVAWLMFLRQMRATGMPLEQLRMYIDARDQGADGVPNVLEVLRRHQESMLAASDEIKQCLQVVAAKIAKYEQLSRTGQSPGAPEV